ncbi:MAG: hypothetical protein GY913_00215 [Proteobacteria bacterium]|nr:hypothetical protein [Pseudomonadota bacterium]
MFLFLTAAFAAEPAHYSADSVASASMTFARYAEALGPKSDALEDAMAVHARSVKEADLGANLVKSRADLSDWQAELRGAYVRQGLEASSFSSWIQDASTDVFTQALDQAVAGFDGELTECKARSGIAAITGPMSGPSSCPGQDVSAALAKAMDDNADLNAVVDQLLAETWPTFDLPSGTQATVPLAGDDGTIRIAKVANALMEIQLAALEAELERDLGDLDRELQGPDAAAALAKAEERRRTYEAQVAAEGEKLMGALEAGLPKAGFDVSICVNPPAYGGCEGADKTDDVIAWAKTDKKVQKALR